MPWGRLDDGLYDHPKLDALGRDRLAGVGLWALAISWCNRRLTDGVVPADRIRLLGGTAAIADRLVEVGLFDRCEDGYRVHDFLAFNDSAETVMARRQAAAERQRKHRSSQVESQPQSRGESREKSQRDSTRDKPPMSQRESRDSTRAPAAARPDPTESRPERVPRSNRRKRAGASDAEGPLLTAAQLDAWRSFGPEWDAFKAAWLERGLRLPPTGGADEEGSQRAVLFPIVRDWPTQVATWVRGAPKGASGADIVGHVIGCYRDAVTGGRPDDEAPDWLRPPTRAEAAEAVGSILGRMGTAT
ncbi:MAG: hypothetical protein AB1627_01255 [Chloroflexota bacterium]